MFWSYFFPFSRSLQILPTSLSNQLHLLSLSISWYVCLFLSFYLFLTISLKRRNKQKTNVKTNNHSANESKKNQNKKSAQKSWHLLCVGQLLLIVGSALGGLNTQWHYWRKRFVSPQQVTTASNFLTRGGTLCLPPSLFRHGLDFVQGLCLSILPLWVHTCITFAVSGW